MSGRDRQGGSAKRGRHGARDADFAVGYQLVVAKVVAGRLLQARRACQALADRYPTDPDIMHLMGAVLFSANEYELAVEWASRAAAINRRPAYLTTLGISLLELGRQDGAIEVFEEATRIAPRDADLWSNLGDGLLRSGRDVEAMGCFLRALAITPRQSNATLKRAAILRQQGHLEEALDALSLHETMQTGRASALRLRALVLQDLGRLEEAEWDNRRAQALDPCNVDGRDSLARNLIELDQRELG
jgi:Flp pilus assembly protein TadD